MDRRQVERGLESRRTLAVVVGGVSVACHLVAFLQFVVHTERYVQFPEFPGQFYFLLAVSLLLSILIVFSPSENRIIIFILLKTLCFIIVGLPLGESLGIEMALLVSIMLESSVRLGLIRNGVVAPAVIVIALLVQRPTEVWRIPVPPPTSEGLIGVGTVAAVLAVVGTLLRRAVDTLAESQALAEQMRRTISKLEKSNIGFQDYAKSAEERSTESERNRITSEIHDSIGYVLTNIMMMMQAAMRCDENDTEELHAIHEGARVHAQKGLQEVRSVLRLLRSREIVEPNGLESIRRLTTAFADATGVKVDVDYCNMAWSYGPEIDRVIYRIVQESLTNAFRHGKASGIHVHFWQAPSEMIINVKDNGTGSSTLEQGIGLLAMNERVDALGGQLRTASDFTGFLVTATIPTKDASAH